jgi:hypothetical protein
MSARALLAQDPALAGVKLMLLPFAIKVGHKQRQAYTPGGRLSGAGIVSEWMPLCWSLAWSSRGSPLPSRPVTVPVGVGIHPLRQTIGGQVHAPSGCPRVRPGAAGAVGALTLWHVAHAAALCHPSRLQCAWTHVPVMSPLCFCHVLTMYPTQQPLASVAVQGRSTAFISGPGNVCLHSHKSIVLPVAGAFCVAAAAPRHQREPGPRGQRAADARGPQHRGGHGGARGPGGAKHQAGAQALESLCQILGALMVLPRGTCRAVFAACLLAW